MTYEAYFCLKFRWVDSYQICWSNMLLFSNLAALCCRATVCQRCSGRCVPMNLRVCSINFKVTGAKSMHYCLTKYIVIFPLGKLTFFCPYHNWDILCLKNSIRNLPKEVLLAVTNTCKKIKNKRNFESQRQPTQRKKHTKKLQQL